MIRNFPEALNFNSLFLKSRVHLELAVIVGNALHEATASRPCRGKTCQETIYNAGKDPGDVIHIVKQIRNL